MCYWARFHSGELWTPSAVERVEVYRRLAQYMKERGLLPATQCECT